MNNRYMVISEVEASRLLEASVVTRTAIGVSFFAGLLIGVFLVVIL